ncbi:MAG TPA: DNA polymerase III subunit delta [Prevotella sp.]|nr:DNA polymerase III subunit delta [uncultured Prevotella sp.]HBF05889.1 DNA polymerase III subunit delta [Candidatus Segatella violae]
MLKNEVIGQQEVWDRLMEMVQENRVPHALMFCGPEGCGKLAMALAFASYLLGENGSEEEQRRAQTMLKKWEHPDLHFTFPTIKTSDMSSDQKPTSLDFIKEWREILLSQGPYILISDWMKKMGKTDTDFNKQAIITAEETDNLSRELSMMSSQGGYKISLIWLPERMNLTSANKILKLLEEPPRQTLFLLVSENPELLLETIRSRVQRIDFKKISTEEVEKALVERRALEPDMAHRIARIANGNWNLALEELDAGNENRQHLDMFIMLMRLAYMRNIHDLKKWSEVVATFGREKQKRMIDYFLHMLRESFMYNFRQPELSYMTQEEENFAKNFARFINEANIIDIANLFEDSKRCISQNANPKIVFFDLALKIIVLLIRK